MKIVIIGGVAGGASAAARLRRLDEKAEIIIFERSNFISYANCGLPYYIGEVIENKNDLTLQTPDSFFDRFNIKAMTRHEVKSINTKTKTVTVKNLETGEGFVENYDKLILSPGAKPILPDFFMENDRIFTLRTVEDALKIHAFIKNEKIKSVAVIGGGFIGMETAENLRELGLDVTVIQRDEHLLNTVDSDMASFIHAVYRRNGVKLALNVNVRKLESENGKIIISADDGQKFYADTVLVAVGVLPDNELAKTAGLELGLKGAIKVNAKMQTSDKDIYAVGDAIEFKHFVTGFDSVISLAGPANKQGRIAADNICGIESEYTGSQGSSVIKIFDMTAASTGITESQANRLGLKYEKVILSPMSHAGYYPGGRIMTIKLIYEKTSLKILGAQIIGFEGVDKRIDVIATAMRANMKANQLKDLDLAYAPPYSSAKDPVNMAGFIVDNIENGMIKQFYYEDLPQIQNKNDVILLDVRTRFEYVRGHADGFINIPLDELRSRLNELNRNKKVYVMCQSGLRSYLAARILIQNGFIAYNFAGGYRLYGSITGEQNAAKEAYTCGMDKN